MGICSVDDCDRLKFAKGFCRLHYQRFWKHGKTELIKNICSVKGCERKYLAKGYCPIHYERVKKNGDTRRTIDGSLSLYDKIIENSSKQKNDCIIYNGTKNIDGYGQIRYRNKFYRVHRVIFEHHNGSIPKGKIIRHKCDNPPCINIDHLLIGTQLDNINDKMLRKRQAKGEKQGASKLTEKQVLKIYELAWNGEILQRQIAKNFNVSKSIISDIKHGKTWSWLTGHESNFNTI